MAKRSGANAEKQRAEKRQQVSDLKIGRYVVLVALLATAGYFGYKYLKQINLMAKITPMIELEGIDIAGTDRLDSLAIADAAGVDSGMTLIHADRKELLEQVKSFPGVASAKLGNPFSKRVKVTITEREPVAFTVVNGSIFFMDETGVIWPFTSGNYWEIPVLTGVKDTILENGLHMVSERDRRRFSGIHNTFNATSNRPVLFDLSDEDRITVRFNGLVPLVRFSNDPKNRVENMRGIVEKLRRDDVEVRHYIDLSYKNVAFFR